MDCHTAIEQYVLLLNIRYLFGCANFPGTNTEPFRDSLSYLHHFYLAAVKQIPAIVRSYLHIGGWFGEGAFLDFAFNTLDVCIILDMDRIRFSDFPLLRKRTSVDT